MAEVSSTNLQSRMQAMYMRDCLASAILVIVLWLTVGFVLLAVRQFMPDSNVEIVCWIAAAILLLFNTASIFAMIRHYANDKQHIYGIDIRHIDANR